MMKNVKKWAYVAALFSGAVLGGCGFFGLGGTSWYTTTAILNELIFG